MPYTPATTFVDGNVILSAQVEGNLDGVKKYLDGGMAAGDLQESSKWVDTRHLMKPVYESTTGTMTFVTGFQGGKSRTYPGSMFAAVSRWLTNRPDSGGGGSATPIPLDDAPFNYVQNTTVKIELPRNCKFLMFQYTVSPVSPYFPVSTPPGGNLRSDYQIYFSANSPVDLNTLNQSGANARDHSRSYTFQEKSNIAYNAVGPVDESYNMVWRRFAGSGFSIEKDVAAGTYYMGLVGRSDIPETLFMRWSISVEAWID